MQRWPEVLQNPENAVKLPPKKAMAVPRDLWNKTGHANNAAMKTPPSKNYSGAAIVASYLSSSHSADDGSHSDLATIYDTRHDSPMITNSRPFQSHDSGVQNHKSGVSSETASH
jgi:hypothetical protein